MKKTITLCALLLFFMCLQLIAQDRQISGKVTSSEDNLGIPGVSVVVTGTTNGTSTDMDGNYKLTVAATAKSLRFSSIGMKSKDVEIAVSNAIDLVMDPDVLKLDEVVVTALGVSREKKSLGYATQEVTGSELSNVKSGSFCESVIRKSCRRPDQEQREYGRINKYYHPRFNFFTWR